MTSDRDEVENPYRVLGLHDGATEADIRRAFRQRARELHPDKSREQKTSSEFAKLVDAYHSLSDKNTRRRVEAFPAQPASDDEATYADKMRGVGSVPTANPSIRGVDRLLAVCVSVREAAFGVNKTIAAPRFDPCGWCHGSGAGPGGRRRQCGRCHGTGRGNSQNKACSSCHGNGASVSIPCSRCHGRGRREGLTEFSIHLPGALHDNMELRLKGEGDPGPNAGPRGDIRLQVRIEPDPLLSRDGANVFTDLTLTPGEARTGGRHKVPTLRKPAHVKVPAGIIDGSTLILKHQGLRLKGSLQRGNQFVRVHVR